jgi:3-hydroxybutyryl-CoA dehydrogenase
MKELKLEDIRNVLILGAGTLGLRIGLQAAISGFKVKIYDISEDQLTIAKAVQIKLSRSLSKGDRFQNVDFDKVLDLISFTTDPKVAAEDADLVSESVIEDAALKKVVWEQFGSLCPPHCIFTTNTSFILPSLFASSTGRADRFCALHFHDVFVANVVDVMPQPMTAPWIVDLLIEFGRKLYQTPIRVNKESAGYVFNYMLLNVLSSAATLLVKEIGSIEDIDRSWMGNFKTPIGPFGMIDQVGLDTAWRIISNRKTVDNETFALLLKSYVDAGKLGIKSKIGFYSYPNPAYQAHDFV